MTYLDALVLLACAILVAGFVLANLAEDRRERERRDRLRPLDLTGRRPGQKNAPAGQPGDFPGMFGRDLRCRECGEGAVDVADDYPIDPKEAVSMHCRNGHLQISGWRP